MQRNRKQNQKGFSLVEVIVAMLMLSIVTVAVLTAFSQSAKSNARSKVSQGAEDLCTNLVEYVEAGGEFILEASLDPDAEEVLSLYPTALNLTGDADGIQTFDLSPVRMGFNTYTVKVTKDNAPEKYQSGLNQFDVIEIGDPMNASVMVDLSDAGSDADGNGTNDLDEYALNIFLTLHQDAVNAYNAGVDDDDDKLTALTEDGIKGKIKREVIIRTKTPNAGKMKVEVGFRYILDSSVLIPTGASETEEVMVFTSDEYVAAVTPAGVTPPAGAKLGSIYLAYADPHVDPISGLSDIARPSASEPQIRVIGENGAFGADIYIAYQDGSVLTVDQAAGMDMATRMTGKSLKISFTERGAASPVAPGKAIHIYCSSDAALADTVSNVSITTNKLVATNEKVRAIGYKFEIYNNEVSGVIASGETVVLQK